MKVLVSDSQIQYANWIPGSEIVNDVEEADLVLFTGGADVDPSLYDEPSHLRTDSDLDRDENEVFLYHQAKMANKKMLGVCRGLSN